MKVMIINSLYYPNIIGGAEKSTQVIAEYLLKSGITPVVVTVSEKEKTDYVNGVKVYYVHHSNVYWSYYSKIKMPVVKIFWHILSLYNSKIIRKVEKIIKIEKPDIVNTNNLSEFSVGIWKVIKKNGVPVVHTLRDYSLLCYRATLFKNNNLCSKKNLLCLAMLNFRKRFSRYPDAVVGNSHFILNEHIKEGLFSKSRRYVVYNALESEELPELRGLPGDKKENQRLNFGYIGHISCHKGVELLLKAFKEKNITGLHVFGKGITDDYENFLKLKYESENIKFHGFLKTQEALKIIDVLIVPSIWHDPLPRVIFEAYSYGVPVIGSNRGGIPEIIDTGKTGFVFNPDSEEELLNTINLFKEKPEIIKDMAADCLKKAKDFLPGRVLKQYTDIYEEIIQ